MESEGKPDSYGRTSGLIHGRRRHAGEHVFLLKQSINFGALAVCNAAPALLAAWYVVTRVGINIETGAFFAPGPLTRFVFLVLSAALLPVLVPLLTTSDYETFREEAWAFFRLTSLCFSLIALGLYASSGVWGPLFVSGFYEGGKGLTVSLTKIQLVSMVLNAAILTLRAAHYARRRFVWIELSGVVANLAGLLFLVVSPRFRIMAAAWNTVFYNSLKPIFPLPVAGRWRLTVRRSRPRGRRGGASRRYCPSTSIRGPIPCSTAS